MTVRRLFAAVTMVLLMSACSAGGGGAGGSGNGGLEGTLVAGGSAVVETRDLATDSGWDRRLDYTIGTHHPFVHRSSATFYLADARPSSEFYVDRHDLRTFDVVQPRAIEWPGTSNLQKMGGFAVSPGGTYVAGVLHELMDHYLEVLALGPDGAVSVLDGFTNDVGPDLAWLNDSTLMFVMDLGRVTDPSVSDLGGAIVSIDLSDNWEDDIRVVVGFETADWGGLEQVHSLAVSHDGSQLAYTANGDIWVKDLDGTNSAPRRLTSGPLIHRGAAFSPDGTRLAFVERFEGYASSAYIIPTNLDEPIEIDRSTTDGRRYRLDGILADRILAWLP